MANIVLLQEGEAIPYPVGDGETIIGRHPECTIQLKSNTVSRRHARFTKRDGQFYIEDLGSGNGTVVNGTQLEKEKPHPINHEDRSDAVAL